MTIILRALASAATLLCACTALRAADIVVWSNKAQATTPANQGGLGLSTAQKAVIEQAFAYWNTVLTANGGTTVNIQIQTNTDPYNPMLAGKYAFASRTSTTTDSSPQVPAAGRVGTPNGGTLNLDISIDPATQKPKSPFFVDPTPADDSEFTYFNDSDCITVGTAAAGTTAVDNTDLLNVIIHEIGHILGFSYDYKSYRDKLSADWTTVTYATGLTASTAVTAADTPQEKQNNSSHLLFDNNNTQKFCLMVSAGKTPESPYVTTPTSNGKGATGLRRHMSQIELEMLAGVFGYTVNPGLTPRFLTLTPILTGAPAAQTTSTTASITIGGEAVIAYRYKLDNASTYGSPTPVATPISLTGLAAGSHTLSILTRDAASNWQTAATIHTWTVATLTALETWRNTHFNQTANTGDAADTADPDADGFANLVEYALDTTPDSSASHPVLESGISNLHLQLTFTPQRVSDLTYLIEASDDLSDWSDRTDVTGLLSPGAAHTHTDAAAPGERRFLRLKVTRP